MIRENWKGVWDLFARVEIAIWRDLYLLHNVALVNKQALSAWNACAPPWKALLSRIVRMEKEMSGWSAYARPVPALASLCDT